MFHAGYDGEHDSILVEGPNFEQNEVTPEQFKRMLRPKSGAKLDISLVVLDKLNSDQLAQVLIDLGVDHVISFKIDT